MSARTVLPFMLFASGIAHAQGPSLQELQRKAVQEKEALSAMAEQRGVTEEKLTQAIPAYVERAVSRVRAKGVVFQNTEAAMAKYLAFEKQYGLGVGRVSYLGKQKEIGVANEYVYYLVPAGYAEPFELKGNMYWDLSTHGCQYRVDFSFNPSKSHPVGEYSCQDFLSGKVDAQFSSMFEAAVRAGFQVK